MRFTPTPDKPKRLDQVVAGATSDARWRHLPARVRRIDGARSHEIALKARQPVKEGR